MVYPALLPPETSCQDGSLCTCCFADELLKINLILGGTSGACTYVPFARLGDDEPGGQCWKGCPLELNRLCSGEGASKSPLELPAVVSSQSRDQF